MKLVCIKSIKRKQWAQGKSVWLGTISSAFGQGHYISNLSSVHVLIVAETAVAGGNPHNYGGNMQTLRRKALLQINNNSIITCFFNSIILLKIN